MYVCMRVRACVCVCARPRARACVRVYALSALPLEDYAELGPLRSGIGRFFGLLGRVIKLATLNRNYELKNLTIIY